MIANKVEILEKLAFDGLLRKYENQLNLFESRLEKPAARTSAEQEAFMVTALHLLYARDDIADAFTEGEKPNGFELEQLLALDERLVDALNNARRKRLLNPGKWRTFYKEIPPERWWWFFDDHLYEDDDQIKHGGSQVVQLVLSGILFAFSLGVILYTTAQLFSVDASVTALLNIGGVVILNGLLNTPFGEYIISQLFGRGIALLRTGATGRAANAFFKAGQVSLLSKAVLFTVISLAFPILILPGLSALAYQQGVNALENERDLNAANFYISWSARLQPAQILPITQPDVAARLLQLGELYLDIGDRENAVMVYEAALRRDSRIVAALLRLAELALDDGDTHEALRLAERSRGLLESHDRGEIVLPVPEQDLIELRYNLYIIRARIFLNEGHFGAAKNDLRDARDLVDNTEGVFQNRSQNILTGVNPVDLYYYSGFTGINLIQSRCSNDLFAGARNDFIAVISFTSNSNNSRYRIWADEATNIIRIVTDISLNCDNLVEKEIVWPSKASY